MEDYLFQPGASRHLRFLQPDAFWQMLTSVAKGSLREIFGAALTRYNDTRMVEVGKGKASLGCLRPGRPPTLYSRQREERGEQVRILLWDEDFYLDLPVTDIRLFQDDHATPDGERIRWSNRLLQEEAETIIGVGLTRPFSPDIRTQPAAHWLQVNNLHFQSQMDWRLD